MKSVNIGNFKFGIDMLSDEAELAKGTARDAINVDLTLDGGFRRRPGLAPIAMFAGGHSMWSPRSQAYALFAQADALRMIQLSGATPTVRTVGAGLRPSDAVDFCELESRVVFTNGFDLGVIENGSTRMLGVSDPAGAPAITLGAGGLMAGRYACGYSFLNARGEESGLSPLSFIDLPASGGIAFALPSAPDDVVSIRLFTSPVNGDVLYQMAEVPAGLASATVGDDTPGKLSETQNLHRMLPGDIVRVFKGRLMVASGPVLIFSEPFNYGLTSRRHNFVQFEHDITMLEAVDGGVYVGTANAVYFLAGDGPSNFTQAVASLNIPIPGASTMIESAHLSADLERLTDAPVAVWLGVLGYSVGLATGLVHDVQSERIRLPDYEVGSTVAYTTNGLTQLISVVQSEQSNGAGSAIDSIT